MTQTVGISIRPSQLLSQITHIAMRLFVPYKPKVTFKTQLINVSNRESQSILMAKQIARSYTKQSKTLSVTTWASLNMKEHQIIVTVFLVHKIACTEQYHIINMLKDKVFFSRRSTKIMYN